MQSLNKQRSAVGQKAHTVAVHVMAGHWCQSVLCTILCMISGTQRGEDTLVIHQP